MRVFPSFHPVASEAERRVLRVLRAAGPGLVLPNVLLPGGSGSIHSRECDAIVFSPGGLFTVEVKGTRRSGAVQTSPNGPWTIGGERADFFSGPNPLSQSRRVAQLLRTLLRPHGIPVGYIPAVIVVVGNSVACPAKDVNGFAWACDERSLIELLYRHETSWSADTIRRVLHALEIEPPADFDADDLVAQLNSYGSASSGPYLGDQLVTVDPSMSGVQGSTTAGQLAKELGVPLKVLNDLCWQYYGSGCVDSILGYDADDDLSVMAHGLVAATRMAEIRRDVPLPGSPQRRSWWTRERDRMENQLAFVLSEAKSFMFGHLYLEVADCDARAREIEERLRDWEMRVARN